jgi:flavin-dependent dehydrogenase
VVVIGGGPAGATVATLVAQGGLERGLSVLLLERAPEPRFKVGESLMPATFWTLDRMGVLDKMRASFFPKKMSVQFFTTSGRATSPFYFFENDDHPSSQTWQVTRKDFDGMLLEHAAEQGVDVRLGANVREVLFEGDRAVGVRVELAGLDDSDNGGSEPTTREIRSRVVVDASGQSAFLARKLGLRQVDECLRNVSYFTHFEGAKRDHGIDEGATLILHTRNQDSWFWFIPLPEDRASVGVVGPVQYLVRDREGDPQEVFEQELALCEPLQERLEGACQVREVQVAKDFSYLSDRIAGDGWVMAGDAFGFLDPIYSSGIFLALQSGEMAADAILEALEADDVSAARLGSFHDTYLEGMKAFRKLVYAFYDKDFSFARFLERFPECREPVVELLVGNVFRKDVSGLMKAIDTYWAETRGAATPQGEATSAVATGGG